MYIRPKCSPIEKNRTLGHQYRNIQHIIETGDMVLESQRLYLQDITWDDLPFVHCLHSYPEVDEFNAIGIPKDLEDTKKVLKPIMDAKARVPRKAYTWIVQLKSNKNKIGIAGLHMSCDKYRLGEIYYKLLPSQWGNGYATEIAQAIIKTGFEVFSLHKVEAGVAIGNKASIRVLEKVGMVQEGQRRKMLPIRGQWIDNYHYAIVEDDPRLY